MNFTQFPGQMYFHVWIPDKGTKMKAGMNSVSLSGALMEQKTHPQKKNSNKDKKIKAQTELIEQQKWEIENLKAAQATGCNNW